MSVAQKGFTLIELVIVVSILAVLIASVVVTLDPITQFQESRNARRWSDLNSLGIAISRYVVSEEAYLPGVTQTAQQIGSAISGCANTCTGADACVNLAGALKPYLERLPADPLGGNQARTGYSIRQSEGNGYVLSACGAENGGTIEVYR